jgi:hypothetical protein
MQTLRKPWSTLPGRCRAGVAGLPTRRQQLTSWLKQNEGHDAVALGIDLLETPNFAALANDAGPGSGSAGVVRCSLVRLPQVEPGLSRCSSR